MRTEKLKCNFDIKVRLVYFPLHPETPAEGLPLDVLFGARADDPMREVRLARRKEMMVAEGLPYGNRTHTYNSRLAQELGKWADTQAGGEAIHDAIYRAYFADGLNISNPEILVAIAQSAGLSAEAARKVLSERSFKTQVDEDWALCRRVGVTGVPTFAAGGRGVVGAQPYEVLEDLVVAAGAKRISQN